MIMRSNSKSCLIAAFLKQAMEGKLELKRLKKKQEGDEMKHTHSFVIVKRSTVQQELEQ